MSRSPPIHQRNLISRRPAKREGPQQQLDHQLQQGLALHQQGQLAAAKSIYEAILKVNAKHFDALHFLGVINSQNKNSQAAVDLIDKAILINPNVAAAYINRGNAQQELMQWHAAVESYDKAIRIKPASAEAYYNRGVALKELKQLVSAIASFDKAIFIKPTLADAYWNKSLALLLAGKFSEGYKFYEWRWKSETFKLRHPNFQRPLWLGLESLKDKTILLHCEQGLGDTIQFCRYAKLLNVLGARVILVVQKPLLQLLSNLEGIHQLIEKDSVSPDFDYHCPLMSLPLAFKTTIESIPCYGPYLYARKDKIEKWAGFIGGAGFKIAICWQGSKEGKVDIGRSFPVSLFADIANIVGVRLISIQMNAGVEQLECLPKGMKVETLPEDFDIGDNAFLDTAAVMKCVDLVISSDTALTHLAGALGVKTWLPLKYVPDWRWMLDRADSPWYPSVTIYRQQEIDDWIGVFHEMEQDLRAVVANKN